MFRKIFGFVFVIVFAFGFTALAEEEPLLPNGGLEELDSGVPVRWWYWPAYDHPAAKWSIEKNDVHSGKQAIKIKQSTETQALYLVNKADEAKFDLNAEYRLTAWVKLFNIDGDEGVNIGVNRKGVDGNDYNVKSIPHKGTSDWKKIEITVSKALRETVQFDPIVNVGAGSGYVIIDDIVLEKLTSSETTAPGTSALTESTTDAEPTGAGGGGSLEPTPIIIISLCVLFLAVIIVAVVIKSKAKKDN